MSHAYLIPGDRVTVRQACTKISFSSRKLARRSLSRGLNRAAGIADIGTGPLNAYRCQICGGWHIGHKP